MRDYWKDSSTAVNYLKRSSLPIIGIIFLIVALLLRGWVFDTIKEETDRTHREQVQRENQALNEWAIKNRYVPREAKLVSFAP